MNLRQHSSRTRSAAAERRAPFAASTLATAIAVVCVGSWSAWASAQSAPPPPPAAGAAAVVSAPLYYLPASALDRLTAAKPPAPSPSAATAGNKTPAPAPAPAPVQTTTARIAATVLAAPPLFTYAGAGAQSPPPSPTTAEIQARCKAMLAQGTPSSQLPRICSTVDLSTPSAPPASPTPPTSSAGAQCVDPAVLTHVRMIPCPVPPPSGARAATPPPPASFTVGAGSQSPPPPPNRPTNAAPTPAPSPPASPPTSAPAAPSFDPRPAPPPAVIVQPAPAPMPPALAVAPIPPSPPPPAVMASAPPPAPVVRGAAALLPSGGGSAGVSPLSLPPPRAPAPAAAPSAPPAAPSADAAEFEAGEVIVFAPFAQSAAGALDLIRSAGATVLLEQSLPSLEGLLLRLRADDGDALRLAQTLRQQLPQATVDLHARLFLFPLSGGSGTSGGGSAPRQYARAMLQMPVAPAPLLREVRVGVIDSGVDRVGALSGGVAGERSFLPNEASPADGVHGTAVAALIAGQDSSMGFSGAAPGAKLYIARAMSVLPDGRSYTNAVSVLQALDWLLSEKVPIVNMSLGGKGDATLAIGIAQAIRKGMMVVAAAGNGGVGAAASFPAALPNVIAVTAVDVESKLYGQANRGDYVMISAPGVDVWAPARIGGANGSYVSGTSFAAAWVSGALAVAAGQLPSAVDGAKWSQALCASAKDLGNKGRDAEFGCGLLQVGDFTARLR